MRVESVGISQPPDVPEVSLQVQEGKDGEVQPRQQKVASPQEKAKSLDLEKIGEELNRCIRMFNTHLAFEIDRPSNRIIIKIVDTETEEVIRQIPPEELLRIMHYMDELLGLLVDERV